VQELLSDAFYNADLYKRFIWRKQATW